MLFGITTEWCSASDRNRVHLRPDSPVLRLMSENFSKIIKCGTRVLEPAFENHMFWNALNAGWAPPSGYSLCLFVTRTGEVGWNLFHWAIEDLLEDQPTVCREGGSFADVSRQKLGQSCINSRNRLSIRSGPGC